MPERNRRKEMSLKKSYFYFIDKNFYLESLPKKQYCFMEDLPLKKSELFVLKKIMQCISILYILYMEDLPKNNIVILADY